MPVNPGPEKKTSASLPPSATDIAESLNASLSKGSFGAGADGESPEATGLAQVDGDRK
jgi:hypothetical protein